MIWNFKLVAEFLKQIAKWHFDKRMKQNCLKFMYINYVNKCLHYMNVNCIQQNTLVIYCHIQNLTFMLVLSDNQNLQFMKLSASNQFQSNTSKPMAILYCFNHHKFHIFLAATIQWQRYFERTCQNNWLTMTSLFAAMSKPYINLLRETSSWYIV